MGGAHVLVVDDDGYLGNAVEDALHGRGCRVSRAEEVTTALGVLRREDVDVVVADHVMPGLSGLVLATGHLSTAFRFIERPFDPVAIRFAVSRAKGDLAGQRWTGEWARESAGADGGRPATGQLEACSA